MSATRRGGSHERIGVGSPHSDPTFARGIHAIMAIAGLVLGLVGVGTLLLVIIGAAAGGQ